MRDYYPPLEPDKIFHIFNHAVSKDNLFENEGNYYYFLKRYTYYISSIADTFAYYLMPNHFHFAIRIKDKKTLLNYFSNKKNKKLPTVLIGFKTLSGLVSQQFSNLFNSYSQAFNKQQKRQGTLFRRPFRRLIIDSDDYFREIIRYIHYNPVHHRFVKDMRDWKFSSYESYLSTKPTLLKKNVVIDLFDDIENFLAFHQKRSDEDMSLDLEL